MQSSGREQRFGQIWAVWPVGDGSGRVVVAGVCSAVSSLTAVGRPSSSYRKITRGIALALGNRCPKSAAGSRSSPLPGPLQRSSFVAQSLRQSACATPNIMRWALAFESPSAEKVRALARFPGSGGCAAKFMPTRASKSGTKAPATASVTSSSGNGGQHQRRPTPCRLAAGFCEAEEPAAGEAGRLLEPVLDLPSRGRCLQSELAGKGDGGAGIRSSPPLSSPAAWLCRGVPGAAASTSSATQRARALAAIRAARRRLRLPNPAQPPFGSPGAAWHAVGPSRAPRLLRAGLDPALLLVLPRAACRHPPQVRGSCPGASSLRSAVWRSVVRFSRPASLPASTTVCVPSSPPRPQAALVRAPPRGRHHRAAPGPHLLL